MAKKPGRHGQHYLDSEIALLYLIERSDTAKELLAQLLERSEDAIDMVWRWIEGADFPEDAENRIHRQVETIRDLLGDRMQSSVSLD